MLTFSRQLSNVNSLINNIYYKISLDSETITVYLSSITVTEIFYVAFLCGALAGHKV